MNTNPKGKSKATVQLMMMAFCFLMIVLLVIIMGKMSRASKPDYENAKLVRLSTRTKHLRYASISRTL